MGKIKHYGLIAFVMMLSLLISGIMSKEVFIANSPTIRPHLGLYLAARMKNMMAPASSFIAKLRGKGGPAKDKSVNDRFSELGSVPFSDVAKGVAAKEQNGVAEVRYELDKIKWVEYTFTKRDGSTIVIKIPEGQNPPPAGAL